ncbi:MAG TPA: deoxyribonuclease IV [Thermoguttaceae bacterium]|nr:deoxyribonuclease IV [Thermoguttaceae bacterium]
MSIAGGCHKAVERAAAVGCDAVQLFTANPRAFPPAKAASRSGKVLTKSNNQWRAKTITPLQAEHFRDALKQSGIAHSMAHDSYLINLASPDRNLWRRSVRALAEELRRADTLGIPYVVAHPGAHTTGTESAGLRRIVRALDEIHARVPQVESRCLLETTAGQGTSIGWRFEHLATILDGVKDPDRLGICFDTCHVFAAGYSMQTKRAYNATMRALGVTVGLKQIKAFHLNDSRRELGSRVDRHAPIGRGEMGLEPFRFLLADRRFRKVPMVLETPKGQEDGIDCDVINLRTLRGLIDSS